MENEKITSKPRRNSSFVALGVGFLMIVAALIIFLIRSAPTKENQNITNINDQKEAKKGIPISSDELLKKITAREKVAIIDIRNSEQFIKEHILDSKNLTPEIFENYFRNADKKATYIIVDSFGDESAQLSYEFSKDFGMSNVLYLTGGFELWKGQLNPTIKEGDPTSFSDQSKVKYVKSDDLKKMVDENNPEIKILDIRKTPQFNEGHIKNSINIPYEDLESRRNDLPRGKNIIVVDADGAGAFKAAVKLFDLGFFNTQLLSDGLNKWKEKGFELIK